ncbi:oxidoreductase [Schizosaccharomyces japonicus yFS275]|uniref:Oxidoreductase n=1 Tax=Schizosaccharomyces japonicus (strain yFS275 / FY16936) TaxID=402676 RepID=B6K111_SCHJY|nr:oxidoreductase [Schizosaccharomyces japonicus yFS275]EEB07632.1 oxidoreductase [Schizosaccharomyces japonicus yFS275]
MNGDKNTSQKKLRLLTVGTNAISAFLSWRLSESKSCHVTMVWRSQGSNIMNDGIRFRSSVFGAVKWKPDANVSTIEELEKETEPFDYILLCVKVLPDVYSLKNVVSSVLTPGHTCIILNTTSMINVEQYLTNTYPRNLVLSFVTADKFTQRGPLQFEHITPAESAAKSVVHVGLSEENKWISPETQNDIVSSLALSFEAGGLECKVQHSIGIKQWETALGHIAFFPLSVIVEEPNLAALYRTPHLAKVVDGLLEEGMSIAKAQGYSVVSNTQLDEQSFRRQLVNQMLALPKPSHFYQDFLSLRPLEIVVLLENPIKLAEKLHVPVPRMETIYALLELKNKRNKQTSPTQSVVSLKYASSRRSVQGSFAPSPLQHPLSNRGLRMASMDDLTSSRHVTAAAKRPNHLYSKSSVSLTNLSLSPESSSSEKLFNRPRKNSHNPSRNSMSRLPNASSIDDFANLVPDFDDNSSPLQRPKSSASFRSDRSQSKEFDMLSATQRMLRRHSPSDQHNMDNGGRRNTWTGRPPPPSMISDPVDPIIEDELAAFGSTSRYPSAGSPTSKRFNTANFDSLSLHGHTVAH